MKDHNPLTRVATPLDIQEISEEHIGMVFERAKGLVRKVTLELVYEVVDERTKEIIQKIEELERRREEDFKYLNQKIDTQAGQLRGEMGQLRHEIGQLRNEIKRLDEKIDTQTAQLRQEMNQLRQEVKEETNQLRQDITQINHRIDTVIQMLSEILRK